MKRREFVAAPLVTAAMTSLSASPQESPQYDTILKGGHVIDVANRINQQMDIAVLNGKMWTKKIDNSDLPSYQGTHTIISRQLIEKAMHIHVYADEQPEGFDPLSPTLEHVYFHTLYSR